MWAARLLARTNAIAERMPLHCCAISMSTPGRENLTPFRNAGIPINWKKILARFADSSCINTTSLLRRLAGNGTTRLKKHQVAIDIRNPSGPYNEMKLPSKNKTMAAMDIGWQPVTTPTSGSRLVFRKSTIPNKTRGIPSPGQYRDTNGSFFHGLTNSSTLITGARRMYTYRSSIYARRIRAAS